MILHNHLKLFPNNECSLFKGFYLIKKWSLNWVTFKSKKKKTLFHCKESKKLKFIFPTMNFDNNNNNVFRILHFFFTKMKMFIFVRFSGKRVHIFVNRQRLGPLKFNWRLCKNFCSKRYLSNSPACDEQSKAYNISVVRTIYLISSL